MTDDSLKQADPGIMSHGPHTLDLPGNDACPDQTFLYPPSLGWFSAQPRTPIKRDEVSGTQGA
jgi:hypothetical protein